VTLAGLLHRALADAPEDDPRDARILDAALQGAATMDEVARRAGVGRMTVFRRFGSKEELLERLAVRELRRFLDDVAAELEALDDPGEQVAAAFVACVRAGAEHPLLARTEPGRALERLFAGDPSPFELGRAFVAARLAAGRVADPEEVADVLVRLAASYALLREPGRAPASDDELRAFARRRLAPITARR